MAFIHQATEPNNDCFTLHRKIAFYGSVIANDCDGSHDSSLLLSAPYSKTTLMKPIDEELMNKVQELLGHSLFSESRKDFYQQDSRLVISASNKIKVFFDIIMDCLLVYSVVSSLYYLGYSPPNSRQYSFDLFVWAMFIIDFFLNFVTERKGKTKESIKNIKLIFLRYLKTWMLFDIASLLPLHFSGNLNAECFLRLFRIFKMNRLVKLVNGESLYEFLAKIFSLKGSKTTKIFKIMITYTWDLFYQVLVMLFFTYALSCIWSYFVIVIEQNTSETKTFHTFFGIESDSNSSKVIKTWYFIYTTLLTVGYGDFYATNKYEMGLCIFLLVIGPSMYAIIMSKAIDTMRRLESIGKLEDKLSGLDILMASIDAHYSEVPIALKEKILNHFKNYFLNDRAGILAEKHWRLKSKEEINQFHNKHLAHIPQNLQFEILNNLFKDTFYKFKVFFGDEDNFRFFICLHIQPRIYSSKTEVISADTIPKEIFFVETGRIACGIKTPNDFFKAFTYKARSIIGDYFVYNKIPSFATYITHKTTVGFSIPGKVARYLMKQYPLRERNYRKTSSKMASIAENTIKNVAHKNDLVTEKKLSGLIKNNKPKGTFINNPSKGIKKRETVKNSTQSKPTLKEPTYSKTYMSAASKSLKAQISLLNELKDKFCDMVYNTSKNK